ncbi:MAG TPA: hypothetical protein VN380_20215 [Thermoanaerobaculia bacterium]|nr:hypothetical protein [Thermoanaerobaculia bacterium]
MVTLVAIGTGIIVRRVTIARSTDIEKPKQHPQIVVPISAPIPTQTPEDRETLDAHSHLEIMSGPSGWKFALRAPWLLFLVLAIIGAVFGYFWLNRDNSAIVAHRPVVDEPIPPIVVIVGALHVKMDSGLDEAKFNIRRHANNEVIKGNRGAYYMVDLKDAQASELVFFRPGKYLKDEFGEEFRSALAAFQNDVTAVLAKGRVPFRIYVRGSADIVGNTEPIIGALVGDAPKTITYYPAAGANVNQFIPELRQKTITRSFANDDLPDLRASYIQDRLADVGFQSTVLQGCVTTRENEIDRNATILLFVDWPAHH